MTDLQAITVTRRRTASATFTITRDGAPLDIEGMSVTWAGYGNDRDAGLAIGPLSATIVDGDAGVARVDLSATDTDLDQDAYLWQADVEDLAGHVVAFSRGILHVLDSPPPEPMS